MMVRRERPNKLQVETSLSYAFIHFAVEVICFYVLINVYKIGSYWWVLSCLYDTLAFGLQPIIGAYCEKHQGFKPGITGGVMLVIGALMAVWSNGIVALMFLSLVLITIGNGMVHISGALATLRVSEGRLSESAVFVGGGSFGVITGKLLGAHGGYTYIPVVLMIIAILLMAGVDRIITREYRELTYDFEKAPCKHNIATKSAFVTVAVLGIVVMVRAYIGYGLPTAWNKTVIQSIFLFTFMGIGKMSGGILADLFGARRVGGISCIVAVPMLLMSNNIMWLSLLGVACFSMTMAITLGGLVSVMKSNPGIAFGVTTNGLLLGTVPLFFVHMPSRVVCNWLIVVLSVLAAVGLFYCVDNGSRK